MARPISETLDSAQRALIAMTGQRVSQTELQRLSWRLEAGDTPAEAAEWVQAFFALHDAASEAARLVEPGAAAQAAYDCHCNTHGARFGYAA